MKRVIIDIPDEYAGAVSVTAIGVGQVGMRSEAHFRVFRGAGSRGRS